MATTEARAQVQAAWVALAPRLVYKCAACGPTGKDCPTCHGTGEIRPLMQAHEWCQGTGEQWAGRSVSWPNMKRGRG